MCDGNLLDRFLREATARGGEAGHDGIPWLKNALVAVALCTIALLAYSDSFRSGFVFDNQGLILQDPRLLQATTKNVELILQHTYMLAQG